MIVPTTAVPETAPPASPAALGMRRFWVAVSAAAPFIVAALVDAYQRGELPVPARWAIPVSIAVAAYLAHLKAQKEQGRAQDAAQLEAQGVPIGKPLDATAVKLSLTSDFQMPADAVTPRRSTGP